MSCKRYSCSSLVLWQLKRNSSAMLYDHETKQQVHGNETRLVKLVIKGYTLSAFVGGFDRSLGRVACVEPTRRQTIHGHLAHLADGACAADGAQDSNTGTFGRCFMLCTQKGAH